MAEAHNFAGYPQFAPRCTRDLYIQACTGWLRTRDNIDSKAALHMSPTLPQCRAAASVVFTGCKEYPREKRNLLWRETHLECVRRYHGYRTVRFSQGPPSPLECYRCIRSPNVDLRANYPGPASPVQTSPPRAPHRVATCRFRGILYVRLHRSANVRCLKYTSRELCKRSSSLFGLLLSPPIHYHFACADEAFRSVRAGYRY